MAAHAGTCLDRRVNLFCDGIVGVEVALASLRPEAFAGRTAILRPFWELAKVPPRYAPLLHRFQEIWAPSEFVRAAFAASIDVPVLHMPLPIALDAAPRASRGRASACPKARPCSCSPSTRTPSSPARIRQV